MGANGTFNLQTGATFNTYAFINSGGIFKIAGGAFGTGNIELDGGTFATEGNSPSVSSITANSGTIEDGSSTSSILTFDVPYQMIDFTTFAPVNISTTIVDGSTASLGLNITGGQGYGVQLMVATSYSGETSLSATLQAGANNVFSPYSAFETLSGGILDAGAFSESIGSLTGNVGTVNVDAGGNLSIGSLGTSSVYSGQLTGGGTITKVGGGTLTLNGGGTFTGTITINGGTLAVGVTNGIPTGATVNFGGISGTFSVNANQSLASYSAGDLNVTSFSNNATLTV